MRVRLSDPPFAGRTGKGVVVAVLDSGVHPGHPHVPVAAVVESVPIDPALGDAVDRLGHGTAVSAAILDIAPGCRLIVGKVFDRSLATNAAMLARGIDWAVSRGARVVNLSLGTATDAHAALLGEAVTRARDAGAIVVSARESNGVTWLPGALPGVIGVTADPALEREEIDVDGAGVAAAPYPRPIPGVPKERNLSGVSFAVANATGFLARLLEAQSGIADADALLQRLRQGSDN